MRHLYVFESISVDGCFVDRTGDMSWAHRGRDDAEFSAWVSQNASSGGALLFGRKTYQMMESFWPTPLAAEQMPEVAQGMNAAEKHLASRSIKPTWQNTRLLQGDAVEAVRALKASAGSDITVLGSGSLVAQLAAAGLIDRYQFVVVPVVLGAGRTVFADNKPHELKLLEQRGFRCGNVVLTYAA